MGFHGKSDMQVPIFQPTPKGSTGPECLPAEIYGLKMLNLLLSIRTSGGDWLHKISLLIVKSRR